MKTSIKGWRALQDNKKKERTHKKLGDVGKRIFMDTTVF